MVYLSLRTHCSSWAGACDMLKWPQLLVQRRWRGRIARNYHLNFSYMIHVGYELKVFEKRQAKRSLVSGFIFHVLYISMLIAVFFLQHGRTVGDRHALVGMLKNFVTGLETPTGKTISDVANFEDFWEWSEGAFLGSIRDPPEAGGRVTVRSYNQLIGSVRLSTIRVDDSSCSWKDFSFGRRRTFSSCWKDF